MPKLLRSCVLDQDDFTALDTSTVDQLLAVRRPIETDHDQPLKMCNLLWRPIAQPDAPNVVAALAAIDIRQLAAIRAPADARR
jgi:hypothetical protein